LIDADWWSRCRCALTSRRWEAGTGTGAMTAPRRSERRPPPPPPRPGPAWWNRGGGGVLVAMLAAWTAAETPPESRVYVGRGSTGRLDCPYSADPPATLVVWLKDGRVVDAEDRRLRVVSAGSLLIRAARSDDEGLYACAVYSPSGSTDSSPSVRLLVRGTITEF